MDFDVTKKQTKREASPTKDGSTSAQQASTAVRQLLDQPELPGFILITAPDLIRRNRIEERFRQKLATSGVQVIKLRGEELTPERVTRLRDEMATLSLFAGPKLYVLNHLEKAPESGAKMLAQVLSQPLTATTVLGLAAPLLAASPLAHCAAKHDCYIKFPDLSGAELLKWSMREAGNAGLSDCPPAVIERIIELTEQRPDAIAALLSHLAVYLDGEPATLQSLATLFPSQAMAGEFELIDAVASGAIAKAELLFDTLL
ncbi:MAG: hypothetical protein EBZ48_14400, partial [Proteobacteria bacterium]|nr:hypothetical protein [Pseudomonadota bacterium]